MDFEFIFRDSKSKVTKPHTCYGPQVQVQGARVFVHIFVYYYHYYCYYCYYYGYPQPGNMETFEVMDLKEAMVNRQQSSLPPPKRRGPSQSKCMPNSTACQRASQKRLSQ